MSLRCIAAARLEGGIFVDKALRLREIKTFPQGHSRVGICTGLVSSSAGS